ncbi:F-box/LRR-repeat protein 4 [Vitis vinifera]|uniref:F-box/LRR-repeat protein 4 n=1 Tax=Vitis vinifera TaxID=29760 RepID=A0A438C259_VITVI|nr:F-box/LRR-repeat protein 4 [Vitis vinifera]
MRRFQASHVAQRCRFIDRRIRLVLYGSILLETLGDDELGLIFNRVHDPDDRKSFSQVCKQWVIRNAGVASLVKMAKNSKELNLGQCVAITDHALEAIGVCVKNPEETVDCRMWAYHRHGGVVLQAMCCSEELNLACCGSVTDTLLWSPLLALPEFGCAGPVKLCGAAGEQKPGLEVHQTECVDANGDASWQILQVGLDFGVRDGGCSVRKSVKVLQEFRRKDKEHDFVMEKLGDDELGLIINWVHDHNDRRSISQVCKQWLRVEGQTRLYIRVLEAEVLHNFLPRFPNLVAFQASGLICNAHLECVAQTCPKIEVLNLNTRKMHDDLDESDELSGLNGGIHAIANGCRELRKVYLRRRGIGNFGVVSLLNFGKNLTQLDLGRCNRITDQALEAIGYATSLCVLNLRCCWLITDSGLAMLANGSTARTLKKTDYCRM